MQEVQNNYSSYSTTKKVENIKNTDKQMHMKDFDLVDLLLMNNSNLDRKSQWGKYMGISPQWA